jgi:hypothetical protein
MMDMCTRYAKTAVTILFVFSCFSACGELDTVLSSSGTYQVDALINNELSLSECSLISTGDPVSPYFVSSVSNDPDITGLLVFLQTPREPVGPKTHYLLKPGTTVPKEESIPATGKAPAETRISIGRIDKALPPFTLPETLETGPYSMVFQVLGKDGVLFQDTKSVYYLGDAEFFLDDIRPYLPGDSTSPLILPGLTIMLEAKLAFDVALNPYIVWYNGKKRISEGYFSSGANCILWEAPEQASFEAIRAAAFPQGPMSNFSGKSQKIVLPVSEKAAEPGYFSNKLDQLSYLYLFQGNLKASKAPADSQELVPQRSSTPQWAPAAAVYGLRTGSRDVYLLPAFTIEAPEHEAALKTAAAGRFMLRLRPVSEGTIFSVRLPLQVPGDAVSMDLSVSEKTLKLEIAVPPGSAEIPLDYSPDETGVMVLFIDFIAGDNSFEAALSMEQGGTRGPVIPQKLALPSPLKGEGSFQLGAPLGQAVPEDPPAAGLQTVPHTFPVSAVFDELALAWGDYSPHWAAPEYTPGENFPSEPVELP